MATELRSDDKAPPYSTVEMPENIWIDNVTDRHAWRSTWAIRFNGAMWCVGPIANDRQMVVGSARTYPLAVCRAAVQCPRWGTEPLELCGPTG